MPAPRYKVDEFLVAVSSGLYRAAIQRLLGKGPGYRDGMSLLGCLSELPPDKLATLLEWIRKENATVLAASLSRTSHATPFSSEERGGSSTPGPSHIEVD